MCTVPGKSGTFRDSAHNTLQFLLHNHINTHTHLLYSFSAQQLHIVYLELCNVVQLHYYYDMRLYNIVQFTVEKCISNKDKM
jgi:hypothetical protein